MKFSQFRFHRSHPSTIIAVTSCVHGCWGGPLHFVTTMQMRSHRPALQPLVTHAHLGCCLLTGWPPLSHSTTRHAQHRTTMMFSQEALTCMLAQPPTPPLGCVTTPLPSCKSALCLYGHYGGALKFASARAHCLQMLAHELLHGLGRSVGLLRGQLLLLLLRDLHDQHLSLLQRDLVARQRRRDALRDRRRRGTRNQKVSCHPTQVQRSVGTAADRAIHPQPHPAHLQCLRLLRVACR